MSENKELRPCPFCGKEGRFCNSNGYPVDIETFWATCGNIHCHNNGEVFSVEEWQTRPLEDALREENVRMRKALVKTSSMVYEASLDERHNLAVEIRIIALEAPE